jgi:hypothetical protein
MQDTEESRGDISASADIQPVKVRHADDPIEGYKCLMVYFSRFVALSEYGHRPALALHD